MEDLTDKQLGSYQIVALLGGGGMAAIYKAYQPTIGRYVALKVLRRYLTNDPQFIGRFQQEAKVVAKLQLICRLSKGVGISSTTGAIFTHWA